MSGKLERLIRSWRRLTIGSQKIGNCCHFLLRRLRTFSQHRRCHLERTIQRVLKRHHSQRMRNRSLRDQDGVVSYLKDEAREWSGYPCIAQHRMRSWKITKLVLHIYIIFPRCAMLPWHRIEHLEIFLTILELIMFRDVLFWANVYLTD